MGNNVIFSRPMTGWDVSAGQTIEQRKYEKDERGFYSTFSRTIIVGSANGNVLREWKRVLINVHADQLVKFVHIWNENGYTEDFTRSAGLQNLDAEEAACQERIAEIRARREARRKERTLS